MNTWTCTRQGELYHHGIKGQKWGVRRFQNKDGSLTPAGRRRYDEPNTGRKTSESVTIDGQTFKVYGRNNKQYADKVARKAKDMGATVSAYCLLFRPYTLNVCPSIVTDSLVFRPTLGSSYLLLPAGVKEPSLF